MKLLKRNHLRWPIYPSYGMDRVSSARSLVVVQQKAPYAAATTTTAFWKMDYRRMKYRLRL